MWIPAWAVPVVALLARAEWISPVLLIPNPNQADGEDGPFGPGAGGHVFRAIERKLFPIPEDAEKRVPLDAVLDADARLPVVTLDPGDFGARADRVPDLDLVLDLSPLSWPVDLYRFSRSGAWICHSPGFDRIGPDRRGLREVWENRPVTAVTLTALNTSGTPLTLARAWFQTDPLSPQRNRSRLYWKAGSLIRRELDEGRLREHLQTPASATSSTARESIPEEARDSGLVRSVFRTVRSIAKRKRDYWLYSDQWVLLYQRTSDPGLPSSLNDLQPIVPPSDRFWADPHVVERDGTYYVFLEEYLYSTRLGHISVMEIDNEGGYTDPVPVLKGDDHLSYPFVFEHEGDTYMVPETLARRSIELYRCRRFPDQWEFVHALISDIDAVDATLVAHGGRWWLFVSVRSDPGSTVSEDLYLYHADSPLSRDWTPHPASPVVQDPRRARPAGGLFERDGKLFRPGQIGVPRYGYGVVVHEITELSESAYDEQVVRSIVPDPDSSFEGSHTLSWAPGLIVMDAILRRRTNPLSPIGARVLGKP